MSAGRRANHVAAFAGVARMVIELDWSIVA